MNRPAKGVRMGDCRECYLPITFVHLNTGRLIPVNPIPDPDRGNVAAAIIGGSLHGYVLSAKHPEDPYYPLRYVPHFATCEERDPEDPEPEPELPPMLF